MRSGYKYLLAVALAVLANLVPAGALPALRRDSRVQEGTLGCGVTYYLVKNDQAPGFAHVAVAGKADAPMHHFPAVPVYKTVSLDSTLVKAFSLMTDGPSAIVVSGDIDPAEIRKKLDLLSIQLPSRPVAEPDTLDRWSSRREPVIRMSRPGKEALSRVEVCYEAPPVPAHQRNTAQALVTDIFSRELVFILRHRLEKELAGIPCQTPLVTYEGLATGNTWERFRVSVSTPEEHLDRVTALVAGALSCLEKEGVTREELDDARAAMMPAMAQEASAPLSNREWAIRCIRDFHYGTHLAPFSEEYRLFGRKALEGDVYKDLLNSFSSGLLDHARNLTLTLETTRDTLDYGAALNSYIFDYLQARIDGSGGRDYSWHAADTLALNVATTKIRIKSERTEPLSGGTLWTFSNGLRVVFKPVKGSGRLHYAWQLDGGLAQISGLKEGEGGHIGPLLDVFGVGEMSAADFHNMLAANGITLESRVALNGLALCGSAPSERLSLLLKALLAVSANRSEDMDAFQDYLQRETLSGESPSATMLRKLHPGYVYGSWKGALSEKTLKKAEKFYDARLPHLADGILIISGDLSEETVKKHLLHYVGAIAPDHTTVPRRPVTLKTASGTQTVSGSGEGAFLLADAAYSYTAEHFYTALIAADELQDRLERRIGPGVKVALKILRQPQEHFRLLISVECREDLPLVRSILQAAAAEALSDEDLKARQKKLEAVVKARLASPEGQVVALLERYSVNKDVTSRYGEAISAITAEGVQEFLRLMAEGGRIEYQGHE